ncbi:hypothetical protein B0680_01780 [Moraxella pluranimalium]|uniref:Uncharacterized protein n=2 Tax=Moraxella pluranimalium TaxID=470453 RepID=A0A1T0CTA8_9GAMM|nr:hypothetical protein B0680_01780 [Moraxella pluranimalium]
MPIPSETISSASRVKISIYNPKQEDNTLNDGDRLALIWYGAIKRNGALYGTRMQVSAIFVKLDSKGLVSRDSKGLAFIKTISINLEYAHRLTIGSVVRIEQNDNENEKTLVLVGYLKPETFAYAIQEGGCEDLSFYREKRTSVSVAQDKPPKEYHYKSLSSSFNEIIGRVYNRHQVLCFKRDGYTFVMHPLTWFLSYYASTKRINRYILSKKLSESFEFNKPKTRRSKNFQAPLLEDGLRLNVKTHSPNSVLLSDWMRLPDVVFLHYLKFNEETRAHIRRIQGSFDSSIHTSNKNLNKNQIEFKSEEIVSGNGFLSDIGIWHDEAVGFQFNAVDIGENKYLITSITSITYPNGDGTPLEYEVFSKPEPTDDKLENEILDTEVKSSHVKILTSDMNYDSESITLVDGDANNPTRLWVMCKTGVIGMRKLVKIKDGESTSAFDMVAEKTKTKGVLLPEEFATGQDKSKSAHGKIGQAMLSNANKFDSIDSYPLTQRHKELYRQVKDQFHENVYYYRSVGGYGRLTDPQNLPYGDLKRLHSNNFPNKFLALYGCDQGCWYAFIDLVPKNSTHNLAGVAIRCQSEELLRKTIYDVLCLLAKKGGIMKLESEKLPTDVKYAKYNHTEEGNWVKTAIEKLQR